MESPCVKCNLIADEIKLRTNDHNKYDIAFDEVLRYFVNMDIEAIESCMYEGDDEGRLEEKFFVLAVLKKIFTSSVKEGATSLDFYVSDCGEDGCHAMKDCIYVFYSKESLVYEAGVKFRRMSSSKFHISYCLDFLNREKSGRGEHGNLMIDMAMTELDLQEKFKARAEK